MDYANYNTKPAGNKSGVNKKLFAAPLSTFTLLATAPSDPTAVQGESVVILTAHTFPVDAGFIELQMTEDTAEALSELNGDNADSLSDKVTLTAFKAGLSAANIELAEQAKNEDWIILFQDCGTTFQIGSDCSPAQAKASFTTGKRSGGAKGYNWTFEAFSSLRIYEGDITKKA